MPKSAFWPLQLAFVTALRADATLTALITGVFDHVASGQAFDYVRVGDPSAITFGTFARHGRECTVTLDAFSGYQGKKQAALIMERFSILFGAPTGRVTLNGVGVTGFTVVACELDFEEVFREDNGTNPDQPVYHGVSRFRLLLSEV